MKVSIQHSFLLLLGILMLQGCARPLAQFTSEQSSSSAPAKIELTNTSKNAESYRWDFGDGTESEEEAPGHTFNESGQYTITLYATKGKKTNKSEQVIKVGTPSVCLVEMTTDFGKVVIALSDDTPLHRDNFLKLVEEGFYEGLLFHRVISGFMLQGGDPTSRNAGPKANIGSEGPGYLVPAEFRESQAHVKGALAAARTGGPSNPEKKSSGSQFYIVHGRPVSASDIKRNEARRDMYYSPELKKDYLENGGVPFLDGDYTVFGKVISGMEVIDKIANTPTDGDPPKGQSRPLKDVKMSFRVIQ